MRKTGTLRKPPSGVYYRKPLNMVAAAMDLFRHVSFEELPGSRFEIMLEAPMARQTIVEKSYVYLLP